MDRSSQNKLIDKFESRIDKSWHGFLDDCVPHYYRAIDRIFNQFNIRSFDGYYSKKIDKKTSIHVFPSLESILYPFRYSRYNKIKAIILHGEPMDNGYSEAYLWSYRNTDSLASPFREKQEDPFVWFSPSLHAIQYFVNELRETKFEIEYNHQVNECTNLNPIFWLDQGVLCLYASPTVEQFNPYSHCDIWIPFMSSLLECIVESKPKIAILALGMESIDVIDNCNNLKSPVIKWNHDLDSLTEDDCKDLDNPLKLLNNSLIDIGHKPIIW